MGLSGGTWRATITARGGGSTIGEFTTTNAGECNRTVDAISTARIDLTPPTLVRRSAFGDLVNTMSTWEHELHLWRDGVDSWCGPIRRIRYADEKITIQAADLFAWMERRFLSIYEWLDTDAADMFAGWVLDALRPDPSPNIALNVYPAGNIGNRFVDQDFPPRAADELRTLAESGVDYTQVGRNLFISGDELPLASLGIFPQSFFAEVTADENADNYASKVTVVGSSDGGPPPVGSASMAGLRTGLVEQQYTDDQVTDESSAVAEATMRLAVVGQRPIFPEMRFAAAPVSLADLIPGRRADLRLAVGTKEIIGLHKLTAVKMAWSVRGSESVEEIQPTFAPTGFEEELA